MKYSEFRDVVKKLINGHYKMKASESEMIDFESKLIDYIADSNYKFYVRVPCGDWTEDVKMTSQDLLRFVRKPRAVVKIEKLLFYNDANKTFSNIYYDVREPDEFGNYPECPEIPKEFLISSKLFRIRKNDLPDLLEEIKYDDPFDLKDKEGMGKERNDSAIKPQETKSIEKTLSYDKTTGKFRFRGTDSKAVSKTSRARKRKIAEQLMECWQKGKPCLLNKIVKDPTKKTPQGVHDDISDIRNILKEIYVNMPQCAEDAYSPPSEAKHFYIINKS